MPEQVSITQAQAAIRTLLLYIGEDPDREGLKDTPLRVLRSYGELFAGYQEDPAKWMKTFEDGVKAYDEMVVLADIDFCSFCEHHWLIYFGRVHVGYLPNKRVVGISKLARLVEMFARRLQIQEKMTTQITDTLMEHLEPMGAGCIVEATHSCMGCRGVKKPNARMVTSCLRGEFLKPEVRSEFFLLAGIGKS